MSIGHKYKYTFDVSKWGQTINTCTVYILEVASDINNTFNVMCTHQTICVFVTEFRASRNLHWGRGLHGVLREGLLMGV